MKRIFKPIIVALTFFLSGQTNAQVSSRIDQFYLDPAAVNPAAISLQKGRSLNLFYNRAFVGVTGGPESVIANLVMPSKDKRTGFGVFYLRENIKSWPPILLICAASVAA